MCDAVAALALSITLEELTHLEEEHDEDGLRKLRLGPWQETDTEGADGGDRHEEMLIERSAVPQTLGGFAEGVVTDEEIWYKVHEQQLPCGQRQMVLYPYCGDEQQDGDADEQQLTAEAAMMLVVMLMMVLMVVLMVMLMMVLVLVLM